MNNYPKHLESDFKKIFNVNLKKYWKPFFGFDIVRFDEEIIKSLDGKSMKETINDNYNEIGVKLIEFILDFEKI